MSDRIMDPSESSEDNEFENIIKTLRPQSFADVVGRQREKDNLQVLIDAAKKRSEALDHILLHGPPGLGKTSLAQVIANEAGVEFYSTSGAAIEKKGDLASILTNLNHKTILFIDEIHRLHKSVEELLYSAMEDRVIDIIIGKGPAARSLKLELNDITIIGATTRVSMLSSPLRDRFGLDLRLDYYSAEEMAQLVTQKAKILDIKIDPEAAKQIATRARRTPRIAVRILKRIRDLAQVNERELIDNELAQQGLLMLNIDDYGLDQLDRRILQTLINDYKGRPVGLNTLAAAVSEELDTIRDVYEPFLLQEGFLIRTAKGRVASEKALKYFSSSLANEIN